MPFPQVGSKAPDFQLADQTGKTVSLAQFAGKNVVLYFYPKDDTPGCTWRRATSATSTRRWRSRGGGAGRVAGHHEEPQKFANKFSLQFPLLADTEHKVADAYGAWGEKVKYGRTYMGIIRSTVLIDGRAR